MSERMVGLQRASRGEIGTLAGELASAVGGLGMLEAEEVRERIDPLAVDLALTGIADLAGRLALAAQTLANLRRVERDLAQPRPPAGLALPVRTRWDGERTALVDAAGATLVVAEGVTDQGIMEFLAGAANHATTAIAPLRAAIDAEAGAGEGGPS